MKPWCGALCATAAFLVVDFLTNMRCYAVRVRCWNVYEYYPPTYLVGSYVKGKWTIKQRQLEVECRELEDGNGYSFAASFPSPLFSISAASLLAHSLITFLCILPLANFGTSSIKTTPPPSRLCLATREVIHFSMSTG